MKIKISKYNMPFKNPLCQEQEPMKTKNQGNMQLFYLGISLPIMYFATKEWKNMKTSAFTIWLLKIKMTFTFYQAPSWKLQNRQFYHLSMNNWEGLTFKTSQELRMLSSVTINCQVREGLPDQILPKCRHCLN